MSETPGPAISLETAVEELLRAAGQLLRRLRKEANPAELTWSEASALARLEKNGPLTTADLARAEAVKPQSMGTTLAGLEQQGLIERRHHPTDGRQVLFALTDEGTANRRRSNLLKRQWMSAAMAKLDPEEQRTIIAAAALIKRLADS
jgi:DNA-binding MarR family transcriptional regulator